MRSFIVSSTLVLAACGARSGGPQADSFLDIGAGAPQICLPTVPDAGRLSKDERARWDAGVAALRGGDAEAARAALSETPEHPAELGLLAIIEILEGGEGAWERLGPLVDAHPEDACLAQVAAFSAMQIGEATRARALIDRALSVNPEDAEYQLLRALLTVQLEGPGKARPELEKAAEAHPDHVGIAFALGVLLLEGGDLQAAIPRLEVARDGGMPLGADLVGLYFQAGRTADYLREASAQYWPLNDDGVIAKADDPMAAYREHLGYTEGQELHAVFRTSLGDMDCTLLPDSAPVTVANFVGLARGTHPHADPDTGEVVTGPYYEGTVIHRVIPDFMIQGGDPTGTGSGGPGYNFPDEIDPELKFDVPGVLAMANSGPGTNGSQWFITDGPAGWLEGRHTIFGTCDQAAREVAAEIARVPRAHLDRPVDPVVVEGIDIEAR